ncbi:hypothetical protein [Piscirickettsia salmonis]|uniref:hypothetical protein n=1 Tax=Piscirickettsia salmonis TaxID=1238 RepID=UPI0003033A48|nr:hypothetical protein [Piscirickettsia salmonis]
MTKLLRFFAVIFLYIMFISLVWAVPAPQTPDYFFRADTRPPEQVFGSEHTVGPGFVTWANTRGVPADYNVLRYANGQTVAPSEEEDRTAGWVSAAGYLEGVQHFLNYEVINRGVGFPNFWVYQIAPSNRAYSLNWILEDFLGSPAGVGTAVDHEDAMDLLGEYSNQNEWITRDGMVTLP